MKKSVQVKSYTRKTKSGKTVTVKAHTTKRDCADCSGCTSKKSKGAGSEFARKRNYAYASVEKSSKGYNVYNEGKLWNTYSSEKEAHKEAAKIDKSLKKYYKDNPQ